MNLKLSIRFLLKLISIIINFNFRVSKGDFDPCSRIWSPDNLHAVFYATYLNSAQIILNIFFSVGLF